MKTIVITGSTRGIGKGLAKNLLQRGHNVVLHGRGDSSVESTVAVFASEFGQGRVSGAAGDASKPETFQRLWDEAIGKFGQVDFWINNAGIGHPMKNIWELSEEAVNTLIDVDLTGVIHACRVVVPAMLRQGGGQIFNMEGFGSNGRTRAGISVYGTAKAGIRFLTKSLAAELRETPVFAGALSPGIVITDFILEQYADDPQGLESAKKVFNILGDRVETVTPWLVDRLLANTKNGSLIEWLPARRVLWRFLTAAFRKRDLFSASA